MLYTAKCYWPGVSEAELERAVSALDCRGALYFPGDEVVLCVVEAASRAAVKEASERAGLPCERVIDSVWIEANERRGR